MDFRNKEFKKQLLSSPTKSGDAALSEVDDYVEIFMPARLNRVFRKENKKMMNRSY